MKCDGLTNFVTTMEMQGGEANIMSTRKHPTSSTRFERTVRQSFFRKDPVVMFDQNSYVVPDRDRDTIILRLARLADFSIHQFDGASVNEQKLVTLIVGPKAAKTAEMSSLALINKVMKQQKQGLIVIHNAHKLTYDAAKFLAKLIRFTKRNELPCKYLLLADVAAMDTTTMFRLSIDRAYPKSVERVIRERERPIEARIDDATAGLKKASTGLIERLSERLFG